MESKELIDGLTIGLIAFGVSIVASFVMLIVLTFSEFNSIYATPLFDFYTIIVFQTFAFLFVFSILMSIRKVLKEFRAQLLKLSVPRYPQSGSSHSDR